MLPVNFNSSIQTERDRALVRSIQQGIGELISNLPPLYQPMGKGLQAIALAQVASASIGELRSFLVEARERIDNLLEHGTLEPPAIPAITAWICPFTLAYTERIPTVDDAEGLADLLEQEPDELRRVELLQSGQIVTGYLLGSPQAPLEPAGVACGAAEG